jgi:hypothetical protein
MQAKILLLSIKFMFSLAPPNANRLIHVPFSAIICISGNFKTATETVFCDVGISQHDLTYVDKPGTKMSNPKTDMIISINSISQYVFHLM